MSAIEANVSGAVGSADPPDDFSCVHEYARWFAENCPDRIAYTFLVDGETRVDDLRFGELDRSARSIGACLQQRGQVGDRVLLVFDTGLDFIKALVGCFYAGMVAVPTPPLDILRWDITLDRIRRIAHDANAQMMLSTRSILERINSASHTSLVDVAISIDQMADASTVGWQPPKSRPEDLAVLQYTSGSTGTPRGVMLSHVNLISNFRSIASFRAYQDAGSEAVGVSWLPLHHDMGLLGAVLPILQCGRRLVLMSPQQFVERPVRWLQAITRYKAYMSGGPNFAYDLCVRKISPAEREELDLGSWTFAANGAEPIKVETLRRFADYFAPSGFRMSTFCPCYGLAEMTLYVTAQKHHLPRTLQFDKLGLRQGRAIRTGSHDGKTLVSSGSPVRDVDVRIVDPDSGCECESGRLGEIWMAGPMRASGYWGRDEESTYRFRARLGGDEETWYCRSGDQGFFVDDDLFVTGRLDDKIIVRGQNHYPDDIEGTVEACHACVTGGRSVAFGVESADSEHVVIIAEVRKPQSFDTQDVIRTIRSRVSVEHQLQCKSVVLVTAGSLPRTTSGKKQRYLARELFQAGHLSAVAEWHESQEVAATAAEDGLSPDHRPGEMLANSRQSLLEQVRTILSQVANVPRETVDASTLLLGELGLDSIQFMTVHEEVERYVGSHIDLAELMRSLSREVHRDASVEQYVRFVLVSLNHEPASPSRASSSGN